MELESCINMLYEILQPSYYNVFPLVSVCVYAVQIITLSHKVN